MPKPPPRYATGTPVQRANQPEAIGIVLEARFNRQMEQWQYAVQFGGLKRTLLESTLIPFNSVLSPWDALPAGRVSGAEHFVAQLTYHRLRKPPTRIAASFATSRTEIYPHQFRPLLKFLDHPGKRLLIADDVGLGKTIEAGYILREIEARQPVERALVLCPARLCTKWKRELESRFQEAFEIVTGREFVELAGRIRRGREPNAFRWIVSYESARREEVTAALEEAQVALDFLVADEAHRLRNASTLQYALGRVLTQLADAAVFLSATPVQNSLDDLWHLLRLLAPESFQDRTLFQRQIEANRPLFAAQTALRSRPPDTSSAERHLSEFFEVLPGGAAAMAGVRDLLLTRLRSLSHDRADVTAMQYDLSALSPTAPIISRTRKVEALPNRAVRSARWHRVELGTAERDFYQSVESLCRQLWSRYGGNPAGAWALQTAYRITASCIPAAVQYFAERFSRDGSSELAAMLEDGEDAAPAGANAFDGEGAGTLRDALSQYQRLRKEDSKLRALREALSEIAADDRERGNPPRKVVVFSFFRRTLEYLHAELTAAGIANRMIHGLFSVRDREDAIDEFLDDPSIMVLLTSEVGGEGIDLQKASAVVNYDLPWNPMVVEQRIGRIDRIGQRAEVIQIVNLVLGDSIEERILARLFQKIGVFERSIGELDDILGDEVRELTRDALSGALSGEALQRMVEQQADAIERKIHEARAVLRRVDGLLAADQALIDEIDAVTGERQLPSPQEIRLFLNEFLARRFVGIQLPAATVQRVVRVDLRGQLPDELERRTLTLGPEAGPLARRLAAGPVDLTLSREAAYHHPTAELVHLRHPLVALALRDTEESSTHSSAFSLQLERSTTLAPGRYAFLVTLVEIRGQRPSIKLCTGVFSLDSGVLVAAPDETTPILLEITDKATSAPPPGLTADDLDGARAQLEEAIDRLTARWEERERRLDELRREQQHASQLAYLELLLNRAAERLTTIRRRSTHPTAIRLAEARVAKAQRDLDTARRSPAQPLWDGIEREEVAMGFLHVR